MLSSAKHGTIFWDSSLIFGVADLFQYVLTLCLAERIGRLSPTPLALVHMAVFQPALHMLRQSQQSAGGGAATGIYRALGIDEAPGGVRKTVV